MLVWEKSLNADSNLRSFYIILFYVLLGFHVVLGLRFLDCDDTKFGIAIWTQSWNRDLKVISFSVDEIAKFTKLFYVKLRLGQLKMTNFLSRPTYRQEVQFFLI